jgi:hypothetical protein
MRTGSDSRQLFVDSTCHCGCRSFHETIQWIRVTLSDRHSDSLLLRDLDECFRSIITDRISYIEQYSHHPNRQCITVHSRIFNRYLDRQKSFERIEYCLCLHERLTCSVALVDEWETNSLGVNGKWRSALLRVSFSWSKDHL